MNNSKQIDGVTAQRHSFFRRAGLVTAVVVLAGGLGLQAYAHGGSGHRGGFFGGSMDTAQMDKRSDRMLKHLYVEIDATPEQQQKLAPIVKQALTDLQPFRSQMRTARKQAIDLMSAEQIDRGAIERVRAERLQAADALSKRLTQALADAAEVLTPAQRKELAKRMERRHGKSQHGKSRHGKSHRG